MSKNFIILKESKSKTFIILICHRGLEMCNIGVNIVPLPHVVKGASSMEEHLHYKQDNGGSIPLCPNIN